MANTSEPTTIQPTPAPAQGTAQPPLTEQQIARRQKTIIAVMVISGILLIALLVLAVVLLLQPGVPTDRIRDVFIIFLALESLLVGIAVIILMIQVATMVNLLQNEVRPMLKTTNDTLNNLRGTTEFISESIAEPVIQLNEYMASIKRILELLGVKRP